MNSARVCAGLPAPDDPQPRIVTMLYSRQDAATALSISKRKVDSLISDGRLRTKRVDRRVLIPLGELIKFSRPDKKRPRANLDDNELP
jgi:excisionase family DNA binding protein